ncbi:MAG: hypothetical protein B6241_14125 [Spirochaetaceae bacterium 4572_59]|nr:MAG: hypothetical protein B6241_14125 [Spirochaetaceae bacterium 4572_59]
MSYDTAGFTPMKLGYRNTRCHWGTHIACLYQTEKERDSLVSAFLSRGLKDDDFLLYCPAERGIESFRKSLIEGSPEFRLHIDEPDRIRIISAEEAYYPDGQFSQEEMDQTVHDMYERQYSEQHRNIRVATDMTWALEGIPGNEYLVSFEAELNLFIPNRNIVAICLYNLNEFSNEFIMKILKTHPYTMIRGILTRSSYYEPPTRYMNISEHQKHNYQQTTGI